MVLSSDPETIWDELDENATELTEPSWPCNGGSISTPVLASQIRIVLSRDPEMTLDPSVENATDQIQVSCPCSG